MINLFNVICIVCHICLPFCKVDGLCTMCNFSTFAAYHCKLLCLFYVGICNFSCLGSVSRKFNILLLGQPVALAIIILLMIELLVYRFEPAKSADRPHSPVLQLVAILNLLSHVAALKPIIKCKRFRFDISTNFI